MNYLNGKKVLVVDDEPDIVEILSDLIRSEKALVETCSNGRDGLDLALHFRPDIILTDGLMPEMNGTELLSRVREDGHTCVGVLISAFGENLNVESKQDYVDAVFLKPFRNKSLVAFLKNSVSPDREFKKRRHLRLACKVSTSTTYEHGKLNIDTWTVNMSRGGLFIEIPSKVLPAIDDEVNVEVKSSDGVTLSARSVCRWLRPKLGSEGPRGFGLQFVDMPDAFKKLIDQRLKQNS